MKIDRVIKPKSSFLSAEKDMDIISVNLLKNERIKRLLYYSTPNALDRDCLTEEQSIGLFNKNIKLVPKIYVEDELRNYILVRFRNFLPNQTNPEFRNNIIEFDILCPYEQWGLKDFQLRPYRIAAEIDSMFNNKHLTGIGTLEFNGADQMILNDHFGGICLTYKAIHGEEDKKFMPNPQDEEKFLEEFILQNQEILR